MAPKNTCPCGVERTVANTHRNKLRRGGLDWICKKCSRIKNKKRSGRRREQDLMRSYGITIEQYEEMLKEQRGMCRICKIPRPGGKGSHFHVDHDHNTKKVRGLLCHHCNTGLGAFKDSFDLLNKAAQYIKESENE